MYPSTFGEFPETWRNHSNFAPIFSRRLNFQYIFSIGSPDTFSATPGGNGLAPILNALPDCFISSVEIFCFETPSFLAASKVSPGRHFDQVFNIAAVLQGEQSAVAFPSPPSGAHIWSREKERRHEKSKAKKILRCGQNRSVKLVLVIVQSVRSPNLDKSFRQMNENSPCPKRGRILVLG